MRGAVPTVIQDESTTATAIVVKKTKKGRKFIESISERYSEEIWFAIFIASLAIAVFVQS